MLDIPALHEQLIEALHGDRDRVTVDPVTLSEYATDRSYQMQGAALARVAPVSTAEVQSVVRVAAANGIAIVPQGSRTGLAGAASSIAGAILIDFTRMTEIVRIDPLERLAVVQPGVLVADLATAAAELGLFYAPDPVSAEWATIGGTVATNAGGMRCIKYGVTRDSVRSLQLVLADGSIIDTRRSTIKSVAGLDLTSLIVGSEGTLALVTEVTVSLRSAPGPSRGVAAMFPSLESALAAANEIATSPTPPAVLEMLDDVALASIRSFSPAHPAPESARAWLLAVTDARVDAEAELEAFERVFTDHQAVTVSRADTPRELDQLFDLRRQLQPAMQAYRGDAHHGDISLPRAKLGAIAITAATIAAEYGVLISLGGHVGDGNLHPIIAFDPSDAEQVRLAEKAQAKLLSAVQELGGTISGEHGIGTEKLAALDGELSPRVRELQRAIKSAFDPQGILNPGRKL